MKKKKSGRTLPQKKRHLEPPTDREISIIWKAVGTAYQNVEAGAEPEEFMNASLAILEDVSDEHACSLLWTLINHKPENGDMVWEQIVFGLLAEIPGVNDTLEAIDPSTAFISFQSLVSYVEKATGFSPMMLFVKQLLDGDDIDLEIRSHGEVLGTVPIESHMVVRRALLAAHAVMFPEMGAEGAFSLSQTYAERSESQV